MPRLMWFCWECVEDYEAGCAPDEVRKESPEDWEFSVITPVVVQEITIG